MRPRAGLRITEHLGGMCTGFIGTHSAGPVDQFQFVGIDIQLNQGRTDIGARR